MKILIQNRQRHRSLDKARITEAARQILSYLDQPSAELSILFVGDRRMSELNFSYRGKKKSTDVLSFEASIPVDNSEGSRILGDVVINIARAEAQAEASGLTFYDEINRLLVHGVLHLMGHDHESSKRDAGRMMKKEQQIIDAIKKVD